MPFNLEVEFSGLCLYVVSQKLDSDGKPVFDGEKPVIEKVGVLMPDARRRMGFDPPKHLDETLAEPHVGYIRLNLANLVHVIPPGTDTDYRERPEYELLHRFNRQVLDFDGTFEAGTMEASLQIPDLGCISKKLKRIPKLFEADPPPELLMRTVLVGGNLQSMKVPAEEWIIPRRLDRCLDKPYGGKFASWVKWTRSVVSETVEVRITGFGATEPQATFLLRPAEGEDTVSVKIANLCAYNPLEWMEMNPRRVAGPDLDFKWFYKLVTPEVPYAELLQDDKLPVPEPTGNSPVTGAEDCMPAKISGTF